MSTFNRTLFCVLGRLLQVMAGLGLLLLMIITLKHTRATEVGQLAIELELLAMVLVATAVWLVGSLMLFEAGRPGHAGRHRTLKPQWEDAVVVTAIKHGAVIDIR